MKIVNVWLEQDLPRGTLDKIMNQGKELDEVNVYDPNGEYVYTIDGPLNEDVKQAIDEYEIHMEKNSYRGDHQCDLTIDGNIHANALKEEFNASNNIKLLVYLIQNNG